MAVSSTGVKLRDPVGETILIGWEVLSTARAIKDGQVAALTEPLRPLWDGLDDHAREIALNRLEIVQEIMTGYRDGHPELARPGEPRPPFGPFFGMSESRRCFAMAVLLGYEGQDDRKAQRRVRDGEIISAAYNPTTLRNWVRAWKNGGLRPLIDGRSLRQSMSWELIDARYREVALEVLDTLDGDRSTVSLLELDRRIRVRLRKSGVRDLDTPKRITQTYLSTLKAQKGATTRSQRSRALQKMSGTRHYPAIRPGQIVAIDATRADNLVFDPLSGQPCSVEILTAIDVATRVVLALRVVPRSANGLEAGLLVYDVCRPFSLLVEGTKVSDWRWVGLPDQLDFTQVHVHAGRRHLAPNLSTLQGEHLIPSITPDAIHCDHGSIFVSDFFFALLRDLKIDLLLSRGKKPTDNPHVERWHETIQRGLQQIPGYKGRNVSERGSLVSGEPLLTARELQKHLRQFIALDYHREWHSGFILPGDDAVRPEDQTARLSPLEVWDAMVEATGRIDVPQRPDLIYQFLPLKWGTVNHAGVEFSNMTYDSAVLDDYRRIPLGHFRPQDRAAPFFVDPHDLTRIWFRDPQSNRVEPIEWRGAYRTKAPMTQMIVDAAHRQIRSRGGNTALKRGSATRQILNELTELTATPSNKQWQTKLGAAARRVEQSRIDHGEARDAQDAAAPSQAAPSPTQAIPLHGPWPNLLDGDE
ncbi:integrase [Mycobacterium sp. AT1]|nr:integrase [Mycobacterium sp. AT1]